jgi:hypothetical protein
MSALGKIGQDIVFYSTGIGLGMLFVYSYRKYNEAKKTVAYYKIKCKESYEELQRSIFTHSIKTAQCILPSFTEAGNLEELREYSKKRKIFETELKNIATETEEKLNEYPDDRNKANKIIEEAILDIIESINCHKKLQEKLCGDMKEIAPHLDLQDALITPEQATASLTKHIHQLQSLPSIK